MPITPTYPGVYVEEISSGVRTITGVSKSVTAFVGAAKRGPIDKAVRILSYSDFERRFGGLDACSELSYAVRQFFLNGGSDAWVVRIVKHAQSATHTLKDKSKQDVLKITALDEGLAGNRIEIQVDYKTLNPANTFNLTLNYTSPDNPSDRLTEKFDNLSLNSQDARYIEAVINGISRLVTVKREENAVNSLSDKSGTSVSGDLQNADVSKLIDNRHNQFQISVNGLKPITVKIDSNEITGDNVSAKLTSLANTIQTKVISATNDNSFTCTFRDNKLILTSGQPGEFSSVRVLRATFNDLSTNLKLGYRNGGVEEDAVATIRLDETLPKDTIITLTGGTETQYSEADLDNLTFSQAERKGFYALEEVDLFNLLCIPGVTKSNILSEAAQYCKQRRAFLIADAPKTNTVSDIQSTEVTNNDNGAVYYPWIYIADPLNNGKLRLTAPSGTVAGLYARTDSASGVWKAPAGTEANLVGVQALTYKLTDAENGILNPLGINCIRLFPTYGAVAWGARTFQGSDQAASEYKYIPVRRLALFIEESLYRGTQWVVFEPNDEPLWAQIRLNLGAFMQNLFRQGAFQGKSPREAYFVKCDRETTAQNDINLGIVNIKVGFAPLKPAEFVIIQLQQMAGQIQV
ncbi:phage tail sheath subtilisin-like domain-containing protein [Nostoc parmelioides]|uniref:Phage tail sheath subtilisin-like domain-containing protein n=1 Tax=Nostoc parmelioides FACHB-3921 TaxID=2692909 RepID=A0ABR8BI38_9NOSO|nr:phage tail sheath subtilisin-like domain-containing protein [Nostoc parmelioides]MBD2253359.1 phage tail sheath subtilisin-like domain-containing protein [Nostoc parmelioides FACHB-3921]